MRVPDLGRLSVQRRLVLEQPCRLVFDDLDLETRQYPRRFPQPEDHPPVERAPVTVPTSYWHE